MGIACDVGWVESQNSRYNLGFVIVVYIYILYVLTYLYNHLILLLRNFDPCPCVLFASQVNRDVQL